jgi:mycothiol synthase
VATEAEEYPGDAPVHRDRVTLHFSARPSFLRLAGWVALDGDDVIAFGEASLPDVDHNRHQAEIDLQVLPQHRRRGAGRALILALAGAIADDGREAMIAYGAEAGAGPAFGAAAGLTMKQVERASRLLTADLDRAMLDEWIERAAERAAGYSLLGWEGRIAPADAARFAAVRELMSTAPLDDLDWEDERHTAEETLADDESLAAKRFVPKVVIVREDATGDWVGFSSIFLDGCRPSIAEQADTVVHPDHRNRGLGRWLKAVNAIWLLDEHPEVESVRTWNAQSNDAMLGINVAMGFRPAVISQTWQGPVKDVLAAFG